MSKILKKFPEAFLITLALIFLAIIIGGFVWGIGNIVTQVNRSVDFDGTASQKTGFDITGAQALDLHGLVPQSQSQ